MELTNSQNFYGQFYHQNFSLPNAIIFYITKNPSTAKFYKKIIKTCKYFFVKNPIIISRLYYWDGWATPFKQILFNSSINFKLKIWIVDFFWIACVPPVNPYLVSSISPKLYKCDIQEFRISRQIISLNDFLFLTSDAVDVEFFESIVMHEDSTYVALEKLVQMLPKAKKFFYKCGPVTSTITSKTSQQLQNVSHFQNFEEIHLEDIPEVFDIENFFIYIKKNKLTNFDLSFDKDAFTDISEVYKSRLEAIIDEILSTKNRDYKAPVIWCAGINHEKFTKLEKIAYCL